MTLGRLIWNDAGDDLSSWGPLKSGLIRTALPTVSATGGRRTTPATSLIVRPHNTIHAHNTDRTISLYIYNIADTSVTGRHRVNDRKRRYTRI